MNRAATLLAHFSLALLISSSATAQVRTWTDITGKHKVEARFVAMEGEKVVLRSSVGKEIRAAKSSLSQADQRFIDALPRNGGSTLEQEIDGARYARDVEALLSRVAADPKRSEADRSYAKVNLDRWKQMAADGAIRYGGKWRTPAEIEALKKEAKSLVEQASRLVSVSNNAAARELFLKASKADPEGIDADFTLGPSARACRRKSRRGAITVPCLHQAARGSRRPSHIDADSQSCRCHE
jgi:hypothetical protein